MTLKIILATEKENELKRSLGEKNLELEYKNKMFL